MAIVLATTKEFVTVVNTLDPDVQSAPEKTGWIPVGEALSIGDAATKVVIRALAGHEILTCWAAGDRGDVAVAFITRATISVDGKPVDEVQVRTWGWEVIIALKSLIENLSTVPTVARS